MAEWIFNGQKNKTENCTFYAHKNIKSISKAQLQRHFLKITATTTKYNDNDTRGKNGKLQGAEKDVRSLENVFSKCIYIHTHTHMYARTHSLVC